MSKSLQPSIQATYLIDVNLPRRFSLWNTEEYIHQMDIDPRMKDNEI